MTGIRNIVNITLILVGSVKPRLPLASLFFYWVSSGLLGSGLGYFPDRNCFRDRNLVMVCRCNNIAKSTINFIIVVVVMCQPEGMKRRDDESGS